MLAMGMQLLLHSQGHILNVFVSDARPYETNNLVAWCLFGLGCVVLLVGFFGCHAVLRAYRCIIVNVSKRRHYYRPPLACRLCYRKTPGQSRVTFYLSFRLFFPQYIVILTLLIVVELLIAVVTGFITSRILMNLENRLTSKLAADYGHYSDTGSDIFFSESMDFIQYKVSHQSGSLTPVPLTIYLSTMCCRANNLSSNQFALV